MLRRLTVGAAAAVLVAAMMAPAIAGGQGSSRVEKVEYTANADDGITIFTDLGVDFTTIQLPSGPEKFMSLSIEDATGAAVAVEVLQRNRIGNFCGSTETPIPIRPGVPVTLRLYAGRCPDGTPSVVTTGTLTATFVASMPPEARRQARSYSPYTGATGWNSDHGWLVGEVEFQPLDRRVRFEIEDASDTRVTGVVIQGDGELATFCGSTQSSILVDRFQPVFVRVFNGSGCQSGAAFASRGKVTAVFGR